MAPDNEPVTPNLSEPMLEFVAERHLATLTTLRADFSPHVVAVGFTYDPSTGMARVITGRGTVKARNAGRSLDIPGGTRAAVCQVDGRRWLTLEGQVRVSSDPLEVAEAVQRYAVRYRQPRVNPERVVIIIQVDRALGHA
nr:TIGR03618 family F420-dependent PPOX class oxidoreductase [Nakamurella antarctica]